MQISPQKLENLLSELFSEWCGEYPSLILPLAPSASARIYYRLQSKNHTAVGAFNPDDKENEAFISFSKHFKSKDLPVPEIYTENLAQKVYLQEDLGFTTLYSFLLQKGEGFPDYLVNIYKKVVEQLAHFQIEGGQGLDYSKCYPRASFDKQSMLWDFNTFKYYFLKTANIAFDEQALELDIHRFFDFLLETDTNYFLVRDFQTRNIMIKESEPYFIDYQGGRKGALQYDLASLLFQAKANIPFELREEILDHYLSVAETLIELDRAQFIRYYYGYVIMRSIQVLGAYGFRGLYEGKEHFISSIPFALRNIKWILERTDVLDDFAELKTVLTRAFECKSFEPFDKIKAAASLLTVTVTSFSYKKTGIPEDTSGNGGGFAFDCRAIHNPGRYEPYKKLTGRDEPVINFLKHHSNMADFLNSVYKIVDNSVEDYIERSFTNLMVNFGCTGGQHRSVYAADQVAKHIKSKYGVQVKLTHIEQEKKGWKNG